DVEHSPPLDLDHLQRRQAQTRRRMVPGAEAHRRLDHDREGNGDWGLGTGGIGGWGLGKRGLGTWGLGTWDNSDSANGDRQQVLLRSPGPVFVGDVER